ncbi:MAG: MBL fold metallo-hydrolase [Muribaculaceae bacterium]|nr:MBL fold metallo-hydrolase [Muribaculaceae bacterium]
MITRYILYIGVFFALLLSSCSDTKKLPESTDSVQLIRNATLKIKYAGKTILVDPLFSEKGELRSILGVNRNPTVHLTMPVEEIVSGVDFALGTHSHFDHFDKAATKALADSIVMYIQPADTVAFSQEYGFNDTEVINDSIAIDGITIIRTTGEHGRGKLKTLMGDVSGFILKAPDNPTVYIVGDCLYTPEIHANIEKYNPAWIVINSGGAIALPLSEEEGTLIMNEKDVVNMIKASPADCRFIAVHMEAIDHCQTTRSILRNEADKAGISKERLLIPADGEIIKL